MRERSYLPPDASETDVGWVLPRRRPLDHDYHDRAKKGGHREKDPPSLECIEKLWEAFRVLVGGCHQLVPHRHDADNRRHKAQSPDHYGNQHMGTHLESLCCLRLNTFYHEISFLSILIKKTPEYYI